MSFTTIIPLDRYNWELCLNISLTVEQEVYTPSVLYSLAQARFEDLHPYGILADENMVGFIMYGSFGGICWISRVIIDHEYQGQGIGTKAVGELIRILEGKMECKEIRTSYSVKNLVAANFFDKLGFVPINENMDQEIVARFEGSNFLI